jgi:murein DD-endopeptidase MepM/ murein hydrolase activator NlpD
MFRINAPSRLNLRAALGAFLFVIVTGFVSQVLAQTDPVFQMPTSGEVTQVFGDPASQHTGVDIAGGGTINDTKAVVATAAGKVVYIQNGTTGYGNFIVVYHGVVNSTHLYTLYGHMGNKADGTSFITAKRGQDVLAGTPLGRQGNSGNTVGATGIHLHWEVRTSSTPVLENGNVLVWSSSHLTQIPTVSPDQYTNLRLTYSNSSGYTGTLKNQTVTAPSFSQRSSSASWQPDGTILKEGSTLLLVENRYRRGFTSSDRFLSNGYDYSQAISISTASCLSTGDVVNAPPPHRVYRQPGTNDIYFITDRNWKRLFASYPAFRGYGYADAEIINYDVGGITRDPSFPDIHTPFHEGTLVRQDGSQAVYVVSNGNARLIADSETFFRLGYRWKDVIVLSSGVFNTVGRDDIHPITKTIVDSCTGDRGGAADEFAPNLTVNTPSDGTSTSTNQITVSGTASDAGRGESGIARVTVNGTLASNGFANGSDTAYWSLAVGLNSGANTITVIASDNSSAQNAVTRQITVYYQPSNPTPTPTPAPIPAFATSASANPSPATLNQAVTIATAINNTGGAASDVIVDTEIYNSSNQKVFQSFSEHQNFATNQAQSYTLSWTPTAAGQYTVKIGIFNNNWSVNYAWNDNALTVNVGSGAPPPPPPATYSVDIWWPTDGGQMSGIQPFKALVTNLAVSQYTMYWQVDGGGLVLMPDNAQDYPHKEVSVDLSGWNWRGSGPYSVNFVAKDVNGNIITQRAINIYVAH